MRSIKNMRNIKMRNIIFYLFIALIAGNISFTSCSKLVDVDLPGNQILAQNAYNSDATAIAVLNGIYSKLSSTNYVTFNVSIPTITLAAGLSADEFTLWSGTSLNNPFQYYKNQLSANSYGYELWQTFYPYIYSCNAAIEGLTTSLSLTPAVKKQLLGESKFLRAFFYFYLVNLYGDVPLVTTTDYRVNASITRTSKVIVYQQIVTDLTDAYELLSANYVGGDVMTVYTSSQERVRPCKSAAKALLARVYLYTSNWDKAQSAASEIINNTSLYDTVSLNNVFLKNSKETIWQLQPVTSGTINNTADAYFFVLSRSPVGLNNSHYVYLSSSLLGSFETGDKRKINGNWVSIYTDASGSYYYPSKYKNVIQGTGIAPTEYTMILRVGEQYLIRAEARARQNNIAGAQADLNLIRKRAGLPNTTAADEGSLLTAILHERQVELFAELGHRWLDLKRTGNVDIVMQSIAPSKGTTWNSHQQLYPIFEEELLKNPNLTQNPGY